VTVSWIPLGAAPVTSPMDKLFDSTLAAAAATFDIQNIPQTYALLRLLLLARSSDTAGGATWRPIMVRFNNDAGANYDYQQVRGSGTGASGFESFAGSSGKVGNIPSDACPAGVFGQIVAEFVNYAGTVANKTLTAVWGAKTGVTTTLIDAGTITTNWRSSAALNRITLFPDAGQFMVGTRCLLYGVV
jgi:hypothetical protein